MSEDNNQVANVRRMEHILYEIRELVNEALTMIPEDTLEYERAKTYWYAQIVSALDDDHNFKRINECAMQDSISRLSIK